MSARTLRIGRVVVDAELAAGLPPPVLAAAIRDALAARLADAPPSPPGPADRLARPIAAAVAARLPRQGARP